MTIKIDKKIVGYKVITKEDQQAAAEKEAAAQDVIQMDEHVLRPEMLSGSTYKIKTPQSEHLKFFTISNSLPHSGQIAATLLLFSRYKNTLKAETFIPIDIYIKSTKCGIGILSS